MVIIIFCEDKRYNRINHQKKIETNVKNKRTVAAEKNGWNLKNS